MVLVTLLPMLILGGTLTAWLATERRASVEQGLRETARALALTVDREVTANFEALQGLAVTETLVDDDLRGFRERAVLARHLHANWQNVVLLDPSGHPLIHTGTQFGEPSPRSGNLEFLREVATSGQPMISDLYTGSLSGQAGIAQVVPVFRDGQVRYLLAAFIRPQAWSRLLTQFSDRDGLVVAAIDRRGSFIARNRDPDTFVGRRMPEWLAEARDQQPNGMAQGLSLEGSELVSAYQFSSLSGWTLFVGAPTADINRPLHNTLWLAGCLAALLIVTSLALGRALCQRILGPMEALAEAGRALTDLRPIGKPRPIPIIEIERLWNAVADASSTIFDASRASQHAEARYRSIVDSAVDAIVVIDEIGTVQSFNPAAERIFGHSADEVIGSNVKKLMPSHHRDRHDGYLSNYRRTGERKIIGIGREVEGLRKDGSLFPLELSIAEWRAGERRFFTGIMRDITERRAAEREREDMIGRLETKRLYLRAIIDTMPVGLVMASAPDGRVVLGNPQVERILGHPVMETPNAEAYSGWGACRSDDTPLPAEDYPLARALRGEELQAVEVRYRRGDGSMTWISVSGAPIRAGDGRITGALVAFKDIGASKAWEARLAGAKEEAERANLAKSKFLAAASHDLRQPIQSLFFVSSALDRHVQDAAGRDLLGRLGQGLDALKALLDSLLDVSKLDAGAVVPDMSDIPVGPLIDEIASCFAPAAAAKGLKLSRDGACDVAVRSDRTLLSRIIRNLMENAIRYTDAGEVRIRCQAAADGVRIEVADTGIGIPPDQLDRIWEEFHQIGNLERDRSQGLGLGLAIVQRLSRLLGHPVEVRSIPGAGSIFSLSLPLAERRVEAGSWQAIPSPDVTARLAGHGKLAIAIDDDAIVLMGIRAMLEDWGYEVLAASSAEEALAGLDRLAQEWAGRVPDIIVTDYRLRNGQVGTDCLRRIHDHLGRAVPGIVLTGETGQDIVADIVSRGYGVAHKPITAAQMQAAIDLQITLRSRRDTGALTELEALADP
ncbi:hypothetical protein N825_08370 [Skermanella stibiiresistens SB22]|uniref:Sensor protein FixL n=1 Tax=Skermanella stibiiresistens SB22 TaxID=1385369 RepID=W9H2H5_9PROT|nr:hypothetical protein N825_08370 [Skermanella stibiiresistens SB22]